MAKHITRGQKCKADLILQFAHSNCVIVYNTHDTCGTLYCANAVDPVGLGHGNTPEEAVLSLCESLRETADEIEANLMKTNR
jgi:hypothetical protein